MQILTCLAVAYLETKKMAAPASSSIAKLREMDPELQSDPQISYMAFKVQLNLPIKLSYPNVLDLNDKKQITVIWRQCACIKQFLTLHSFLLRCIYDTGL